MTEPSRALTDRSADASALPMSDAMPRAGRMAALVAGGILVSRLVGFVRTWFIARYLGASGASDAYTMALKIPNSLRNLLGEGTLSAAFVPVYSGLLAQGNERGARVLANALLGVLLAAVSVMTLIGIAAAPWLTVVLAPGFDPERAALTTRMIRVLFPMAGLMVLSGWCLGVQNSHRRFFRSYASAAMWSVTQIALLAVWGPREADMTQLAWYLAWSTLAGSLLQVAVQWPEVWRLLDGVRPQWSMDNANVRQVVRNLGPAIAALGVVQVSGFADGFIASFLPDGSVAVLGFAHQLMLLPVALFGISVSASSLPELSRIGSDGATPQAIDAVVQRLRDGWTRILFYIVPSAIALVLFGDLIVGIVLRSGQFGAREQQLVHAMLMAYAGASATFASNRLWTTSFHAMQDYRTPLRGSLISVVVTVSASAALALPWRTYPLAVAGIAVGAALGSWANFAWLFVRLQRTLVPIVDRSVRRGVARIGVCTMLGAGAGIGVRLGLADSSRYLQGAAVLTMYGSAYLLLMWWMGSGEAARLLHLAPRRRTPPQSAG